MPTNEERQEAVKRLREDARLGALPFIDFLGAVAYDVAVERDEHGVLNRLADLIEPEPTVDRDALLDIARQMEWASEASYEEVGVVSGGIVGAWAEKIKEACGEVSNHEV